jgi:hypothetical protein
MPPGTCDSALLCGLGRAIDDLASCVKPRLAKQHAGAWQGPPPAVSYRQSTHLGVVAVQRLMSALTALRARRHLAPLKALVLALR